MDRLLPMTSKLGFGVGQLAEGVKAAIFNSFVLFFYNQILGVPATLTALVLGIATFFDAVTDPVAGYLSDRTRSRFGRRHPWLMVSAIPLGASLVMLFCPPSGMSSTFYVVWLLAASLSLHLFITMYHIPHLALGAEMATDYTDRTRVFTYGILFTVLGGWGFYFLAMSVFFPSPPQYSHGLYNPAGYLPLSMAACALVIAGIGLCVWGTWKEIPHLHARQLFSSVPSAYSLSEMLREMLGLFRNPSFRALFFGSLLLTLLAGVKSTFSIYVGIHFWELSSEKLRWFALMVVAGLPVAFVLAPALTCLIDKRRSLFLALFITVILESLLISLRLFTDWLPANNDPKLFAMILACFFVGGIVGPITWINILSMLADVADEQEWRTGKRQEGAIFSVRSFSLKASGALGGVLAGVALDMISFPTKAKMGEVSGNIIFKLGLLEGPVYGGMLFLGLLLFFGYRLDRAKVEKIKTDLRARQASIPTPEEIN